MSPTIQEMREALPVIKSYYYSFKSTGVSAVDAVLCAVAQAGKSYHHTEGWSDDDYGSGSCADHIQAAADKLAAELTATRNRLEAAEKALAWRPIETCPPDTRVLLYSPYRHVTNPERVECDVYRDTRAGSRHPWATHWLPLPTLPEPTP